MSKWLHQVCRFSLVNAHARIYHHNQDETFPTNGELIKHGQYYINTCLQYLSRIPLNITENSINKSASKLK